MPPLSDNTRLIIGIIAAASGLVAAALTNDLGKNIGYFLRKFIPGEPKQGEKPRQRSPILWLLLIVSSLVFVVGGAIAAVAPEPPQAIPSQILQKSTDFLAIPISWLVLILLLAYFAFSKKPRYSFYKVVRYAFFIVLILSVSVYLFDNYRQYKAWIDSRNRLTLVITRFDGPNPEQYRVTDLLIANLRSATSEFADVEIIPLDTIITESEGSQKAREIAAQKYADIVVWGWYGVTNSDVLVNVHVENMFVGGDDLKPVRFGTSTLQEPSSEIASYRIQQKLSEKMVALTYFLRGEVLIGKRDYEAAIEEFNLALTSENWDDNLVSKRSILLSRGLALNEVEKFDESISDLSAAIQIDSTGWQVYNLRGGSYLENNQFEEALNDFNVAVERSPSDWVKGQNLNNRATVFDALGQYDDAIRDYTEAIDLGFKELATYKGRGSVYLKVGNYANAVNDLTKALKIDPNDEQSLSWRADAYDFMKDYKNAIKDYSQLIQKNPNFPRAYSRRARIYNALGDYGRALEDANHAVEIDPYDSQSYWVRAGAYYYLGEFEKSISDNSKAIELEPDNASYYFNRAICYKEITKYDAAISDVSKAIELDSQNASYYFNRAYFYNLIGDYDKAILDSEQAIEIDPSVDYFYYNLGISYYMLERYAYAKLYFCKVIAMNSNKELVQSASDRIREFQAGNEVMCPSP